LQAAFKIERPANLQDNPAHRKSRGNAIYRPGVHFYFSPRMKASVIWFAYMQNRCGDPPKISGNHYRGMNLKIATLPAQTSLMTEGVGLVIKVKNNYDHYKISSGMRCRVDYRSLQL